MSHHNASIEHAVLSLIRDYAERDMRQATGYTLLQAIDVIFNRQRSMDSLWDGFPAYVWWYLDYEEGEITPRFHRASRNRCFMDQSGMYRHPILADRRNNDGAWSVLFSTDTEEQDLDALNFMLRVGVSIGQLCLSRCYQMWDRYYHDADFSWTSEIIYVEPDYPIDIPFRFPPLVTRATFKEMRVLPNGGR